jgi:DNA-binding GntR family transcriptional regulator
MRRLLRDILDGVYAQGERIREVEVAKRMGVSRAPVREALRVLEQDGLIEFEPFRGARVIVLAPHEIGDLFDLMSVISGAVARFAVRHASDQQLERVFSDFADFERAIQEGRPVIEDVDHAYRIGAHLGQCCGNAIAAEMLARLGRIAYLNHRYLHPVSARWVQQAATRVRKLEAALRARSEDRAEKAARRMILHTASLVVRHATQQWVQSSTRSKREGDRTDETWGGLDD